MNLIIQGRATGKLLGVATWVNGSSLIKFTPDADAFTYLKAGETTDFTFSYQVTDGSLQSANATVQITVTGTNDAPDITYTPSEGAYVEDSTATTIFNSSGFVIDDVDGDTVFSATITINNVQDGDVLTYTAQNGVSGTYDPTTGKLVLTDSGNLATNADFQTVIESIKFETTSDTPNEDKRYITLVTNDGDLFSNTITETLTVTAVNDAPVVSDASVIPSLDPVIEDDIYSERYISC